MVKKIILFIIIIFMLIICLFWSNNVLIKIHQIGSYIGLNFPLKFINCKLIFITSLNEKNFRESQLSMIVIYLPTKNKEFLSLAKYYVKEKLKLDPFFYQKEIFNYKSIFYKSLIFNRIIKLSSNEEIENFYKFYKEKKDYIAKEEKWTIVYSLGKYSKTYRKKLCSDFFELTPHEQNGIWHVMIRTDDINDKFNFFKQIVLNQNNEIEVRLSLTQLIDIQDKYSENHDYNINGVIQILKKKYPNSEEILNRCSSYEKSE